MKRRDFVAKGGAALAAAGAAGGVAAAAASPPPGGMAGTVPATGRLRGAAKSSGHPVIPSGIVLWMDKDPDGAIRMEGRNLARLREHLTANVAPRLADQCAGMRVSPGDKILLGYEITVCGRLPLAALLATLPPAAPVP